MREYELTYLVSDDVLEADLKKITNRVGGIISDDGGKVSKEESWGRRKLAYPIGKQTFATYVTVWFEIEAGKIAPIDHELRVFPQVIRHLITLKVQKSEVLRVTKEDIVETEDVEKVIGEKSFEQVKGETEESYDLMAVRETEELKNQETKEQEDKVETVKELKSPEIKEELIEEKIEFVEKPRPKVEKAEKPVEEPQPKADQPVAEKEEKFEEDEADQSRQGEAEADPSRGGEAEADRIKKLDEKLDELLGDDL